MVNTNTVNVTNIVYICKAEPSHWHYCKQSEQWRLGSLKFTLRSQNKIQKCDCLIWFNHIHIFCFFLSRLERITFTFYRKIYYASDLIEGKHAQFMNECKIFKKWCLIYIWLYVNKLPGKINTRSYTVLCAIHTVYGNEWTKWILKTPTILRFCIVWLGYSLFSELTTLDITMW